MHNRIIVAAVLAVAGLALTVSAATASQAVTLDKVSLLDGPVAGARILGEVDQGSKVSVIWCGAELGLCIVQYHLKNGFVALADLQMIANAPVDMSAGSHSNGNVGPHVVAKGLGDYFNDQNSKAAMP